MAKKGESKKVVDLIDAAEETEAEAFAARNLERPAVTRTTINNVARACAGVDSMTAAEMEAAGRNLRLDLKLLKKQRKDLMEALTYSQAKTTRINKTLQRIAFRLEAEGGIAAADEMLEDEV